VLKITITNGFEDDDYNPIQSNPIFIVKSQLTERNGEQCGKK